MAALLIIPLLISGYLVLTTHPYHFYRLHRYDGQLLYMKATVYGFICLVCSIALAIILKLTFKSLHPVTFIAKWTDFTNSNAHDRLYSWLIIISITCVVIGKLWGYGAKILYLYRFLRALLKGKYKCDIKDISNHLRLSILGPLLAELPIDKMFFESMLQRKAVLVSLKCGKVYVGVITRLSEPNETEAPNTEFSLTPAMSGYRHKDTRRIHFINDYKDLGDVDTTVNIPCSEITHTSWYTHDVHHKVDSSFTGPEKPD